MFFEHHAHVCRDRLEQVPHFDKIYGGWWTTQVRCC